MGNDVRDREPQSLRCQGKVKIKNSSRTEKTTLKAHPEKHDDETTIRVLGYPMVVVGKIKGGIRVRVRVTTRVRVLGLQLGLGLGF